MIAVPAPWALATVILLLAAGPFPAAAQSPGSASPPLRIDVDAAMPSVSAARPTAEVELSPVIVRARRRAVDTLPCIGCDGRQVVPMKRLQDFSEVVESLLVAHAVARPETPEDRALSFAHESGCFDGGFGCLLPK